MSGWAILGIILLLYACVVVFINIKKPKSVWETRKVQFFVNKFGEQGTVIFFYLYALLVVIIGIWLLNK